MEIEKIRYFTLFTLVHPFEYLESPEAPTLKTGNLASMIGLVQTSCYHNVVTVSNRITSTRTISFTS